ncbi:hypothetical protein JTE90_020580 [Oedothorax gibbosus]|uniref:Uncharacterized protein n=1 Tax=Oedothorax gibbosus TaxID=931172 RepID=A0AAV6VYY9_9ARAC|nr:hypothetical protein JTE90_020580 [Oedothorax gibbosus]
MNVLFASLSPFSGSYSIWNCLYFSPPPVVYFFSRFWSPSLVLCPDSAAKNIVLAGPSGPLHNAPEVSRRAAFSPTIRHQIFHSIFAPGPNIRDNWNFTFLIVASRARPFLLLKCHFGAW